ncbi:hypothetical protein Taro_051846 [Colocasia esculenta]|uniref:Uncharacterized protein n=1 Tax=Colocasia esculenta TaxID=4460 RepID=A0A843XH37_COLES|nr:hypothetical protein [Colocasia esculenta]
MVVRTVVCESLAELSWLAWDAEDSLEFYPAQASESSQQQQGARRAEETGRLAVDVYFRYISCQTRVIALLGPPGPWAATAKIGSSAWAEGRVLGSLQLVSELGLTRLVVDLNCNSESSQQRQGVLRAEETGQ